MSSTEMSEALRTFGWWFSLSRFLLIHILCFAAIWTGFALSDVLICVALYFVGMFFVTAGYHRYFSHRTFKMGRGMQFFFAFMAMTSSQKGVLWWAAHHRHHHKYSDQPEDVHSVRHGGFLWAHVGWIFHPKFAVTDLDRIKDLAKFPELVWLDKYDWVPMATMGLVCFLLGGWTGLVVWFLWSRVLLWHGTFTINSLAHVFGRRRYDTTDDSKNSLTLALLTLGEGWHNNHHHFQASTRQGFYWWEVDITYYVLWVMSKLRLVGPLREPPRHVVEDRKHPVQEALIAFRANAARVREDAVARFEELSQIAVEARTSAGRRLDGFSNAAAGAREEAGRRMDDWAHAALETRCDAQRRFEELQGRWETALDEVFQAAEHKLDELAEATLAAEKEARRVADEIRSSAMQQRDDILLAMQQTRAEFERTMEYWGSAGLSPAMSRGPS